MRPQPNYWERRIATSRYRKSYEKVDSGTVIWHYTDIGMEGESTDPNAERSITK